MLRISRLPESEMRSAIRRLIHAAGNVRLPGNKKGAETVGAAIALPIIILAVMLLIRTFTFYLEILNTGASQHMKALEASDGYTGHGMKVYRTEDEVTLRRGGLLRFNAGKSIETRLYMLNEDAMVRAGELL